MAAIESDRQLTRPRIATMIDNFNCHYERLRQGTRIGASISWGSTCIAALTDSDRQLRWPFHAAPKLLLLGRRGDSVGHFELLGYVARIASHINTNRLLEYSDVPFSWPLCVTRGGDAGGHLERLGEERLLGWPLRATPICKLDEGFKRLGGAMRKFPQTHTDRWYEKSQRATRTDTLESRLGGHFEQLGKVSWIAASCDSDMRIGWLLPATSIGDSDSRSEQLKKSFQAMASHWWTYIRLGWVPCMTAPSDSHRRLGWLPQATWRGDLDGRSERLRHASSMAAPSYSETQCGWPFRVTMIKYL